MKKYKVNLQKGRENLTGGVEVVDKCSEDYECYYSFKEKKFFVENQDQRDKSKKTIATANKVIKFMNKED